MAAGKLVEASQQDWYRDMKLGSHRFPSEWVEDRLQWLDTKGIPVKPDMQGLLQAEAKAAMAEAEYCREEGFMWKLACNKVKFEAAEVVVEAEELDDDLEKNLAEFMDQLAPKTRKKAAVGRLEVK